MFFKVLINLSATTIFFIICWILFYIIILQRWFVIMYEYGNIKTFFAKSYIPIGHCLYLSIFFLVCGLTHPKYLEDISNCKSFFYLLKEQPMHIYYKCHKITHNKIRNPLLNLINCISVILAHLILHIKDEYTFGFSNFLITGLFVVVVVFFC